MPGGRYLLIVMLILLPGRDDREGVADARPVIRAREGEEGGTPPATVLLAARVR